MDAITPPPDFEAMRSAIEGAGADAMNPVSELDGENRKALFEHAVHEVKRIRAQAIGWRRYFKRNQPEARHKATQVRQRAERRLVEIIDAVHDAGFLTDGRPAKGRKIGTPLPPHVFTLDQLGIDRGDLSQWRPLAKLPLEEFEAFIATLPVRKPWGSNRRIRGSKDESKKADAMGTTMPIANIKIGTRHRKDMGDVASLACSIAGVGLLHPIVVRPDGTLIAGERRLAAFRQLDRTEIPVTVVDLAEIVRGELAENAERKDFLPSEIEAIRRAMKPIEKAAAKARMAAGGGDHRSADRVGKVSTPDAGKTRDKIGAFAGVSGRTLEKIAAVVAAAEAEPAKFGHLVEEMDRTGKVDRAHRQLKTERQREANAARAECSGGTLTSAASGTERAPPAVNHALNDVAQPGSPALVPEPAAASKNRELVSSNDATQDVEPALKTDAAPPTAPDQPIPTPDIWAHQRAAFYDFIVGLRDVDLRRMFATMPIEEVKEAQDVVLALSAALRAAIERDTPIEEEISPAAWN